MHSCSSCRRSVCNFVDSMRLLLSDGSAACECDQLGVKCRSACQLVGSCSPALSTTVRYLPFMCQIVPSVL